MTSGEITTQRVLFDEGLVSTMTLKAPLIRPVIMCGGSGTRLWPASRETFPKQFAPIIGEKSTFQETLLRVKDPALFGKPVVITNKAHRFMVERQMHEIGIDCDILLEPVARDSGPAIIASSVFVAQADPEALVLILAADHMVLDPAGFRRSVDAGRLAAMQGAIVTFGIVPTNPATGYGYIAPGEPLIGAARKVARFVEKPDAETAIRYITGGYLWNSGNFLFRPGDVIGEYEAGDPASVAAIREAIAKADVDLGVPVLQEAAFLKARKISFDYAVMEKTTRAAVISGDFGWSDIGGWDALWTIADKDADGNAARGDVTFFDSQNSYVLSENQLVTTLGVRDLVVVATHDAVLVADKNRTGEVKRIVDALKAEPGVTVKVLTGDGELPWDYLVLAAGSSPDLALVQDEIGRIRMGEKRTSQRGTKYPAALQTWRLTSRVRDRLDAAARIYGGQVRPWEDEPGQFELYTESDALEVEHGEFDRDARL